MTDNFLIPQRFSELSEELSEEFWLIPIQPFGRTGIKSINPYSNNDFLNSGLKANYAETVKLGFKLLSQTYCIACK